MKLFLSHAGLSEVAGGVERYARYLTSVFKDLKVVDYHSHKEELGDTNFALLREPIRAKKLGEYVSKNYPDVETVFTNGMFCPNLSSKNQVNICHGSYPAFASAAVPLWNPDHYRLKYVYGHFEKKAAQNAAAVISNSKGTEENVRKFFGLGSKIIYPPVDTKNFRPIEFEKARSELGWRGVNILFVGRPERAKGFDLVENIARKYPEHNFRCILSRPYSSSIPNLKPINAISHEKLSLFYSAADLVLFPSRFEGFGLVTIEALACNKKVLALNTGVAREISHENLFISDKESLPANLMRALSADPKNSRSLVVRKFSLEEFAGKWKAAIKAL